MIFKFLTDVLDSAKDTSETTIMEIPYNTLEWYWVLLIVVVLVMLIFGIKYFKKLNKKKKIVN